MSRDIIVHYDAAEGKIVCCTVDATLTAALRAKALPLETPIDTFQSQRSRRGREKSRGWDICAA